MIVQYFSYLQLVFSESWKIFQRFCSLLAVIPCLAVTWAQWAFRQLRPFTTTGDTGISLVIYGWHIHPTCSIPRPPSALSDTPPVGPQDLQIHTTGAPGGKLDYCHTHNPDEAFSFLQVWWTALIANHHRKERGVQTGGKQGINLSAHPNVHLQKAAGVQKEVLNGYAM